MKTPIKINENKMKFCLSCGDIKPLKLYQKRPNKIGYLTYCKSCLCARTKAYNKKHRKWYLTYQREYQRKLRIQRNAKNKK